VASGLDALGLGNNRLGSGSGAALDALCDALGEMALVTQLDLSSNGLRAGAGVALAEALIKSGKAANREVAGDVGRRLRVLDLANNTVAQAGGVALARCVA
jgi:hypothetical protein